MMKTKQNHNYGPLNSKDVYFLTKSHTYVKIENWSMTRFNDDLKEIFPFLDPAQFGESCTGVYPDCDSAEGLICYSPNTTCLKSPALHGEFCDDPLLNCDSMLACANNECVNGMFIFCFIKNSINLINYCFERTNSII